jgi:superfamily II DNA or RNA helicase
VTSLSHLLVQLDPADRARKGDQFELICKWFLTNDPTYKSLFRRVWLWEEWPGRWPVESGIDLVAEDRSKQLWAIQAKADNAARQVTHHGVSHFVAESGRAIFSNRMLIATTDRIHHIGERTMKEIEKPPIIVRLSDLEAAEVDWPASLSDLRPAPPPEPKRPWPYQRQAVNEVVKGFDEAERGQMVMACGTGKTLAALFIKEKLAADRTLVLVPSLSLLKQTLREWMANKSIDFDFRAVCSDETVAHADRYDAALSHTSDLGVPVITDPQEIATFLRQRSGPRVVFATYQSSPKIAEAFRLGRVPAFDLAIADEAHRCAGRVDGDFGTILDSEAIKARRRLFMTATPRYYTGRTLRAAKEEDFEVGSMDDEGKFGKVFHRLGFAEAIQRELLTDYQVVVVGVDDATYRDWAQRGRFVTLDGTEVTDARTLAGQIGLAKAMHRYDLHRTITFHSRVKRAQEFARSLPEVIAWMPANQRPTAQLWTDYASGEMSAGDRHARLQHLEKLDHGERGLLANARCLAEGVDVPALDGVAFIDPRRSEVDIVQAVGRAIRLAPDKTVGTIVIPVFIDTDEDPEIALDDSAFKPVWDVIKAVRAHDDELGKQLDELRRQLGRQRGRPRLPDKIHLDLPARVGIDFARAFDVRLVEQTTVSWEFWFGLLEHFIDSHGHTRVPQSYAVNGHKLGWWVTEQRQAHREGKLDSDRERRLQEQPGWTWDILAQKWEEGFSHLLRYVDQHGHARVPASYTVNGYRLGVWLNEQRFNHSKGTLDPDRERRLRELPGWTWQPKADMWEEGFSKLVSYVDQHSHVRVPKSYTVNGFPLGGWVIQQRHRYRKAEGAVAADRIRRLEELPGWTWDTKGDQWEEGIGHLLRFVDEHGHARVVGSYVVDGYRLGTWIRTQRDRHAKGTLEPDRERRLQEQPGWTWDPFIAMWEEGFSHLLRFVDQHGHARVPTSFTVKGYPLGGWVATQRNFRTNGKLDADRQQRLSNLPGWAWDARADQWEEGFSHLLHYVDEHGHARVVGSYVVDGYRLGAWVAKQRHKHAKGTLDPERERRLQALPRWTWNTRPSPASFTASNSVRAISPGRLGLAR